MTNKITIVTPVLCPSYSVLNVIEKCFNSIRKSVDRIGGEWIVVDDNSTFGHDFFKQISDKYIKNDRTSGVSVSLNRGMKNSLSDFVVKLDADYLVPENLFEILLKDWRDDLCFISPSYLASDPTILENFVMSRMPQSENGVYDRPAGLQPLYLTPPSKYMWGGGIVMFDNKKLKEVDYFDEGFGIGGAQDNDVIYRILMRGYNWRWTNNVVTRHFASISSNDPNAPDTREKIRQVGEEYFIKKHGFEPGGYISKVHTHFNYLKK
jgi:glycosyltransferase involved in cell wall biosynthesis